MMKKVGLVLGSGGAKGIAHIAFLKVLDELEIKPSIITGSSIGAFIGALYASGLTGQELEDIVFDSDIKKLTKLIDFSWKKKTGLLKGLKIMEFFDHYAPVKRFSSLKIPLKIVATDLWKQQPVIFDNGSLAKAVRASISVPGIFRPIAYKKSTLIDGGVTNPFPLDIAKKHCSFLIGIDVITGNLPKKPVKKKINLFSYLMASFDIMQSQLIKQKLKENKPDIYLSPKIGDIALLEFYKGKKILSKVESEAKKFKRKLKKELNL